MKETKNIEKVTVYQVTENVHEMAFMPWSFIQKNGFTFDNYSVVAEFDYTREDGESDEEAIENIFTYGNGNKWHSDFKNARSISVSDIVKLGEKYYYMDTIGAVDVTSYIGKDKVTEEQEPQKEEKPNPHFNKTGNAIVDKIISTFENLLKENNLSASDMSDYGAIYYRNGNDGTDFDWSCNDRVCEFMMYYDSTELGFAKLYVTKEGRLEGYMWLDEGRAEGKEIGGEKVTDEPELFAALCYEQADELGKYDDDIQAINWTADLESSYYSWLNDDEDDEDYYDDEY